MILLCRSDNELNVSRRPIRIPFFSHLSCVGEELTSRPRRGDIYIREDLAKTSNEDYLLVSAPGRVVLFEITPRSFTDCFFFLLPDTSEV